MEDGTPWSCQWERAVVDGQHPRDSPMDTLKVASSLKLIKSVVALLKYMPVRLEEVGGPAHCVLLMVSMLT